jgi:hypothetical protein
VDKFIGELSGNSYYAIGYADDVILINEIFPSTVMEVLQTALGLRYFLTPLSCHILEQWFSQIFFLWPQLRPP